ncbi:MAG: P1 family peptidase, partial [Actinomycetota bacterium]
MTDNPTITAVPGVAVGHSSDPAAATGVTAITFPEPNIAVVDVRGGAPGTRETDTLGDAIKPVTVNALMFAGGSAFGLAAADGVVAEIEAEGRGAPTPAG